MWGMYRIADRKYWLGKTERTSFGIVFGSSLAWQWLKKQLFDAEVAGKRQEIKKGDAVSTLSIIFNTQFTLWIPINPTADKERTLMQTLLYLFVDNAIYVRRRELSASDQTKTWGKISGYRQLSVPRPWTPWVWVTKMLPVQRKSFPPAVWYSPWEGTYYIRELLSLQVRCWVLSWHENGFYPLEAHEKAIPTFHISWLVFAKWAPWKKS